VEIARSWERYDRRQPFGSWARGVARNVALAALRRRGSEPVTLGSEALEAVGAEVDELGDETRLEEQKQALRECLGRLPEAQRQMVRLRYEEDRPLAEIARALGRTMNSIYVTFSNLHRALLDCVRSKTGAAP
jgi:RNA polymerase sigma-70 factor (ECF subfamily)